MQKKLLAVGVGVVDMLVKPMDSLDFETDAHTIDSFVMSSGGDTMNVTWDRRSTCSASSARTPSENI